MKRTPWFNCRTQKPQRQGFYEVRLWNEACRGRPKGYAVRPLKYYWRMDGWDFESWWVPYKLWWVPDAEKEENHPGWHEKDQWRGVLK